MTDRFTTERAEDAENGNGELFSLERMRDLTLYAAGGSTRIPISRPVPLYSVNPFPA